MISEYEVEGFIQAGDNIFVVGDIQVAGPEYTVNITEPFLDALGINQGINMIRNG